MKKECTENEARYKAEAYCVTAERCVSEVRNKLIQWGVPQEVMNNILKRLLEERDKAMNGVNAMKATGFNESDDHEADGGDGTNQTLRLQALGQMGNINRVIQQIEEALHRIDDGTYGVCTVCGQLIRKPRLNNQPFVLTCMECQSEMEKNHK